MKIMYVVKFETEFQEMDSYEDDPLVKCVESVMRIRDFCALFRFKLISKTAIWGSENPSLPSIREGGVRFMIEKEVLLEDIAIIAMAVKSIILFGGFVLTDESLRLFDDQI